MIEDDLKQVIEEYYSTVNMSRKMQLENVLTDFKRNPLSIDLAKQMIVEVGNSSMIKFYFLSVLECQELWDRTKFGADLVATNRQFLWTLLTENLLPDAFLRNKLCQIVADFANHEFPEYWPSYFGDVYNLHQQSLDLCLTMIESTAVEFFVSKRNVPDQVLLYEQMTNLCQILWKVFVWAAPEISGNGTQHKFRAGSTKSQSPSSPSQPGDVVRSTCKLAFGVLGQLVEVLPKYDIFWSDEVVEVLLRYATIDPEDGEFSPMALNVIVDLLEKGHLPVSASRYLPSLFAKTQDVLVYNLTNEVDEEFKNKTISLTGVFLSIHLHRAVKSSPELLQSTLDMFAKFTLKQEDEESFSFCIETWEIMIENGTCKEGDQAVQQIFRNISELMYEGKVIGQGSIKALDLIEKICTAYPQDIGLAFFEKFMEITSKIFQDSAVFANTSQELIAVTRVLGRIISLLENPFMDHFALAKSILLHHARILTFVDSMHKEQANILTDYSHLTNALFSNLTTFVPWLINYQNAIIENDSEESKYSELVLNLVIFTLQWQEKNSADRWTSSSRFLSNCVNELRPDILHHALTAKILNDLVANRKLSYSVCVNMWDFAATLFLVVPFGKRLSRSDLHTKSIEFQSFVAPILQEVDQFYGIDMQTHPNPLQIRMELIFVFMVIKSITNAAKSGNNSTRELAFGSLIDVVPGLVGMVPFFSQDEEGLAHLFEALGLIIATFKYQLLKAGKFDIISNTFDIMENYLLVSPKPAEEIVTHIFDVFTLISTENSKQFDNLVKKLINFILQLNQKLLLTAAPVDLSINMYLLIESVIKNHWTYFFGSKIQGTATPERQQEFLRLFEILATTLTRNETDIARQVISICRDLNQQFHLFEKELFTGSILIPFTTGLISLLDIMDNIKEEINGLLLEIINNRTNYEIVKKQVFPKFEKLDAILLPLLNINAA